MDFNPVGWFEIPAADLDRAKKFYETLFGISLKREDPPGYEMLWFPSDAAAKGVSGAIMKGTGYTPGGDGAVIYFTAPDIDAVIERAKRLGSKIVLPKKDIGEWGFISWVEDSEGNIIGLHRRK